MLNFIKNLKWNLDILGQNQLHGHSTSRRKLQFFL